MTDAHGYTAAITAEWCSSSCTD